jgi:hypothetical protein
VLAGYWLTHALASGGEDIRSLRSRLRPSSTIVAILNTAVAVGAGFILLDVRLDEWRGLYLIGLAALHLPIAGYLFYRGSDRHPFGMLTMGLGLAVAAIAIPVQFSGEVVPIAWAAVAVVLVWLYGRLGNRFSLGAAGSFGILALWHFVLFDYPLDGFLTDTARSTYPLVNGSGAVLGALLLALAASAYLVRRKEVLSATILVGSGLISYALPYELSDGWLIAGWSLVTLALVAVHRIEPSGHPIYAVAGIALSGFALLVTLAQIATPSRLRVSPASEIDHFLFWSDATLALASLAAALVVAGLLHRKEYAVISTYILAAATSLVVYLLSVGLVDEFQKRLDVDAGNLSSLREQAQVGLSILWLCPRHHPPAHRDASVWPGVARHRHRQGLHRRPRIVGRLIPGHLLHRTRYPAPARLLRVPEAQPAREQRPSHRLLTRHPFLPPVTHQAAGMPSQRRFSLSCLYRRCGASPRTTI